MKKVIVGASILAAIMSTAAFADTTYVGGSIGRSTVEGEVAPAFGVIVGHEISVTDQFGVALESGFTQFHSFKESDEGFDGTMKLKAVPVLIKPTYHHQGFSVAPYAGATYVRGTMDVNFDGERYSGKDHDTFATYGLTAGYDVTKDVAVRVDFQRVNMTIADEKAPIKTVSAQVVYKF